MPNVRFNYSPLASTSSLQLPLLPADARPEPNSAVQERPPLPPPKKAARERAGFFRRFRGMVGRAPERPVDAQATDKEEELELQLAIKLSRASFVDKEMEYLIESELMSSDEITALRIVLEKSMQDPEERRRRLPVERNPDPVIEKDLTRRRKDSEKMLRRASSPVRKEIRYLLNGDTSRPDKVDQLRNFLDQSTIEHKEYQRRLATERSEAMPRARESAQRLKKWGKELRKADRAVQEEFRSLISAEDMPRDQVRALRSALENSLRTAREEEDMRSAVKASEKSYKEEQLQRKKREHDELQTAIQLSLASSPAVEDEMRRIIRKSTGMSPEEVCDLRMALEKSIGSTSAEQSLPFNENRKACIRAFNILMEGNMQYCRPKEEFSSEEELQYLDVEEDKPQEQRTPAADYRTRVEDVEDAEPQQQDTGMKVSPDDQMYSDMAKGVRLFRIWAKENGLKIVKTSDQNNNCMLDALMKIASGNYQGNFDKLTEALKAELVAACPSEGIATGSTLEVNPTKKSFQIAVSRINKMFDTKMDVHVIQAGHNGLPLFEPGYSATSYDEEDTTTKTIPVILFNSGNHFEAVVAQ